MHCLRILSKLPSNLIMYMQQLKGYLQNFMQLLAKFLAWLSNLVATYSHLDCCFWLALHFFYTQGVFDSHVYMHAYIRAYIHISYIIIYIHTQTHTHTHMYTLLLYRICYTQMTHYTSNAESEVYYYATNYTYSYSCGWWGWSRCRRTSYSRQ